MWRIRPHLRVAVLKSVLTSAVVVRTFAAILVLFTLMHAYDRYEKYLREHTVFPVDRETQEDLSKTDYDYDFSSTLCGMTRVRNEERTLLEWVSYHTIMGYSRLYIYDDCSQDQTPHILAHMAKVNPNITVLHHSECRKMPDENILMQEMLLRAKADNCDFVGVFDTDEFVTRQHDLYQGSLTSYLRNSEMPCQRLIWWLMGNDGIEERPPKDQLVIDTYKRGKWYPVHLKSICRAKIVVRWAFSLWPSEFISKYVYLDKWLDHDDGKPWETRKVELPTGQVVRGPSQPFFIKHFYVKSLADYMNNRGKRKFTSNGEPNSFYQNVPLWRSFNLATPAIATQFTASMVPKTQKEMKRYTDVKGWPCDGNC